MSQSRNLFFKFIKKFVTICKRKSGTDLLLSCVHVANNYIDCAHKEIDKNTTLSNKEIFKLNSTHVWYLTEKIILRCA